MLAYVLSGWVSVMGKSAVSCWGSLIAVVPREDFEGMNPSGEGSGEGSAVVELFHAAGRKPVSLCLTCSACRVCLELFDRFRFAPTCLGDILTAPVCPCDDAPPPLDSVTLSLPRFAPHDRRRNMLAGTRASSRSTPESWTRLWPSFGINST